MDGVFAYGTGDEYIDQSLPEIGHRTLKGRKCGGTSCLGALTGLGHNTFGHHIYHVVVLAVGAGFRRGVNLAELHFRKFHHLAVECGYLCRPIHNRCA